MEGTELEMSRTMAITVADGRSGGTVALARSWGRRHRHPLHRHVGMLTATMVLATVCMAVLARPAGADTYDPATDPYSMYNTTSYTGATAWWDAGLHGRRRRRSRDRYGRSRPSRASHGPGKVIYGPDLSLESQAPNLAEPRHERPRHVHGGPDRRARRGARPPPTRRPRRPPTEGMAPDARIVSVKVGVADGGVDVSQVIAAIDWVVQHKNDNGLNIRVINLSYGTNSTQARTLDPLAYAAEQAWQAGHRGRRGGRQHRLPARQRSSRAGRPGVRPVRHRASAATTRSGTAVLGRRPRGGSTRPAGAARDAERPTSSRRRFAPAGAPRPEQLHRPEPPRGPDR